MKLCECGCGEPAPISKSTHRAKGHVKGQPVRFISGHNARGIPKSPETRARMSAYARDRSLEHHQHLTEAARTRKLSSTTNRASIHHWLGRRFPKAGICEECGKLGKTDYSFLRHPQPYTRNREDYRELCRSCHVTFDLATGIRPRKRT